MTDTVTSAHTTAEPVATTKPVVTPAKDKVMVGDVSRKNAAMADSSKEAEPVQEKITFNKVGTQRGKGCSWS